MKEYRRFTIFDIFFYCYLCVKLIFSKYIVLHVTIYLEISYAHSCRTLCQFDGGISFARMRFLLLAKMADRRKSETIITAILLLRCIPVGRNLNGMREEQRERNCENRAHFYADWFPVIFEEPEFHWRFGGWLEVGLWLNREKSSETWKRR